MSEGEGSASHDPPFEGSPAKPRRVVKDPIEAFWSPAHIKEHYDFDQFRVEVCKDPKNPTPGALVIYGGQLKLGMPFPFPPFAVRLLNFLKVAPQQLGSVSWIPVASACELERRLGEDLPISWFLSKYVVKKAEDAHWGVERINFACRPGKNPVFGRFPDSKNFWPNSPLEVWMEGERGFGLAGRDGKTPAITFPLKWTPLDNLQIKNKLSYMMTHLASQYDPKILELTRVPPNEETPNIGWRYLLDERFGGHPRGTPIKPLTEEELLSSSQRRKKRQAEAARAGTQAEAARAGPQAEATGARPQIEATGANSQAKAKKRKSRAKAAGITAGATSTGVSTRSKKKEEGNYLTLSEEALLSPCSIRTSPAKNVISEDEEEDEEAHGYLRAQGDLPSSKKKKKKRKSKKKKKRSRKHDQGTGSEQVHETTFNEASGFDDTGHATFEGKMGAEHPLPETIEVRFGSQEQEPLKDIQDDTRMEGGDGENIDE